MLFPGISDCETYLGPLASKHRQILSHFCQSFSRSGNFDRQAFFATKETVESPRVGEQWINWMFTIALSWCRPILHPKEGKLFHHTLWPMGRCCCGVFRMYSEWRLTFLDFPNLHMNAYDIMISYGLSRSFTGLPHRLMLFRCLHYGMSPSIFIGAVGIMGLATPGLQRHIAFKPFYSQD